MHKAIPTGAKSAQSLSQTQSRLAQRPGTQSGHLAQLTKLVNQSPQVQAQLKLAEEIQGSPRVEALRGRAAEINGAASAQLKRLDEKHPAQAKGKLDEKKLKQPKMDESAQAGIQAKTKEEKPRQHKFASGAEPTQLEEKPSANRTGLPDQLKAGVEGLSGISLDSVKVHYNSPKPAQLNALAYAQGTDIHVAPGQQKHLPHEAWHVAQQAQGRVKPTMQTKGVSINDDSGLEREADVMGAKAATVQAADKKKKK
jgi:hypothetical protein